LAFIGVAFTPFLAALNGLGSQLRRVLVLSVSLAGAALFANRNKPVMAMLVSREIFGGFREYALTLCATLLAFWEFFTKCKRGKSILQATTNLAFSRDAKFTGLLSIELCEWFDFTANLAAFYLSVCHMKLSPCNSVLGSVDRLTELAVQTVHEAVLVHTHIIP
jgi:hypothetical protein